MNWFGGNKSSLSSCEETQCNTALIHERATCQCLAFNGGPWLNFDFSKIFLTMIPASQGLPKISIWKWFSWFPAFVNSCARYVPLTGHLDISESLGYMEAASNRIEDDNKLQNVLLKAIQWKRNMTSVVHIQITQLTYSFKLLSCTFILKSTPDLYNLMLVTITVSCTVTQLATRNLSCITDSMEDVWNQEWEPRYSGFSNSRSIFMLHIYCCVDWLNFKLIRITNLSCEKYTIAWSTNTPRLKSCRSRTCGWVGMAISDHLLGVMVAPIPIACLCRNICLSKWYSTVDSQTCNTSSKRNGGICVDSHCKSPMEYDAI